MKHRQKKVVAAIGLDGDSLRQLHSALAGTNLEVRAVALQTATCGTWECPVILYDCDTEFPWQRALRLLLSRRVDAVVVMLSRLADARFWLNALDAGAYDVVAKPFEPEEIRWVVRTAVLRCSTGRRSRVWKEHGMQERTVFVTPSDMARLRDLVEAPAGHLARDSQHLKALAEELDRAEVLPPDAIPADVVTLDSRVELSDLQSGRRFLHTLVLPQRANAAEDSLSVVAPIGTAILGYRAGDVIEWRVPGGIRRLKIEKVLYQPEAADRTVLGGD